MSLELKSLLNVYKILSSPKFYWQKEKTIGGILYPIPIEEKYYDFIKVVFGLHIIAKEFKENEIKELVIETNHLKEFKSIEKLLHQIFSYLTNFRIEFNFVHKETKNRYYKIFTPVIGRDFLLFSGGLDSLSGALQIAKRSDPVLIHIITNQVIYNKVIKLSKLSALKRATLFCFDARSKSISDGVSETRGLFFTSIAFAIVASLGANKIVFCENGSQMLDVMLSSLTYPNKPATKNTNPIYLRLYEQLFSTFNNSEFYIEKIFQDKTKAEAVSPVKNEIIFEDTYSCFTTRGFTSMCGICYNCFIRRMSIEALNIQEKDKTYQYDPFLQIETTSDTYFERQRILFNLLRFYYGVLKENPNSIKEIILSSRDLFTNPVSLSIRFAQDIFLGANTYLSKIKGLELNALGKKTQELLNNIDETLLAKRMDVLLDSSNQNE